MNIIKLILLISFLVSSCYVVYKNKDDVKQMYRNVYAKITASQSHQVDKEKKFIEILPKDRFQIVHEYDSRSDYGKIFGNLFDIIDRGELIVCAKKDDKNILFQMKTQNGEYVGKDIDFAKQMASALGVKVTYRMCYKTYDEVVDAIANGEGDVGIAKLSYTPERARKVLYSSPYVISRKMLLINRVLFDDKRNETLAEILNRENSIIGVTKNTSYETFVTKMFPSAILLPEADWEGKVIELLKADKITATMRDEVRVKLLLKSEPQLLVKLMPIILKQETDSIAVVVNFKSNELLTWINKFIEVDKQNVDMVDQLIERYEEYT